MSVIKSGVLFCTRIVLPSTAWRQLRRLPNGRLLAMAASGLVLTNLGGCSALSYVGIGGGNSQDQTTVSTIFRGTVSADDPQAAEIGRKILRDGGQAADAAAAIGLALAVSMPSRAGLDGGGICLSHVAETDTVDEIDFLPPPVAGTAQIPGLVAGLSALQARYGVLHWRQAVGRAQALAQNGVAVTPLLLADLQATGLAGGIKAGDVLPQRAVADVLSKLRVMGSPEFYSGALASSLVSAGVPGQSLANWAPTWKPALGVKNAGGFLSGGSQEVAFSDNAGGKSAAAAWQALVAQNPAGHASAIAAATAAISGASPAGTASTSFVVTDSVGGAVSCTLTMGKLFGTGKIIPGLDIYAAAPVDDATASSLATAIAISHDQVDGIFSASRSTAAPANLAAAAWMGLKNKNSPADLVGPKPDGVNGVVCSGDSDTCLPISDSSAHGFASTAELLDD